MKYLYNTGITFKDAGIASIMVADSNESDMDVTLSDGDQEEASSTLGGSGGGCEASFGFGALSAMILFLAAYKRK